MTPRDQLEALSDEEVNASFLQRFWLAYGRSTQVVYGAHMAPYIIRESPDPSGVQENRFWLAQLAEEKQRRPR